MKFKDLFENKAFAIAGILIGTIVVFGIFELVSSTYEPHGTPPIYSRGFPFIYSVTSSSDFPPYQGLSNTNLSNTNYTLLTTDIIVAFIATIAIFFIKKKFVKGLNL